jgi:hypothetical protein
MFKRLLHYMLVVFLFGSVAGVGYYLNLDANNIPNPFAFAYISMAYIWGALFFSVLIIQSNRSWAGKTFYLLLLSLFAALSAAALWYFYGTEDPRDYVLFVGANSNPTYGPIPVRAYQLIGGLVFIEYVVISFVSWFFSLTPTPKAK